MANVNPFSPTTSGGRAGQFVYGELDKKQSYETSSIALSRAAKYEAEDQERVDNYVVVLKALDEDILERLQIINDKKQEIVSIIGGVFSSYSDTNPLISNKASVNDPVAEKIVHMAGISTFTYDCGGMPVVCKTGVRGQVYPDILASWQYPNVESLNINAVFYREGEGYVSVTSANLGIGVTAYEFGDAAGATGTVGLVTTANSSLGYYYFWSNLSSVDAGAATSISTLVDEIETLRVGINSSLNDSQDGSNKIRDLKSQAQVDLWFEKKGQTASPVTNYQGGIDSLEENATIIQNYDA